ncbi:MAG: diphosphomevalonate decarboxylase [Chloroflexota bacterium]
MNSAAAIALPNIALIKYWGNRDHNLRIPSNGSISMNLEGLYSRTQVTFTPGLQEDWFNLNGQLLHGPALARVSALLDRVRKLAGPALFAHVESYNNFPTGAGIASSASAFAALSLAASRAAGLELDERQLSRLARTASGSACRSIPGGFVEWQAGQDDESSYAFSIAPAGHWDLTDCVAIVSQEHKTTGSGEGHQLADSSPLQRARLAGAAERLEACRRAILERDFAALAEVIELDSNLMHAVMMTSSPRLLYWQPATLAILHAVPAWRKDGLPAAFTVDAGPNVHVICPSPYTKQVTAQLLNIPGVQRVLTARPGGPARLITAL